eukprot:SAG22_NODE_1217_length_5138_cov_6.636039_5_plen_105_part_00
MLFAHSCRHNTCLLRLSPCHQPPNRLETKLVFEIIKHRIEWLRLYQQKHAAQKVEQKEALSEQVFHAAKTGDSAGLAQLLHMHEGKKLDLFWTVEPKNVGSDEP